MSIKELLEPFQVDAEQQPITPEVFFARSFQVALRDLNITSVKWDELMSAYLEKHFAAQGVVATRADLISARANLSKQLCELNMSWKVYLKGMEMLGFDMVNIRLAGVKQEEVQTTLGLAVKLPQ